MYKLNPKVVLVFEKKEVHISLFFVLIKQILRESKHVVFVYFLCVG